MKTITCPYCDKAATLYTGAEIYHHRPDLREVQVWSCRTCDATVGCHKNSYAQPLGRLANAELRKAKMMAHAAFDPWWKVKGIKRKEAYLLLSQKLGIHVADCHIGMFDVDMCKKVIEASRDLI